MKNTKSTSRIRIMGISILAIALITSAVAVVFARSSINKNTDKPYIIGSGEWTDSGFVIRDDWEGLVAVDVEPDKYNNEETKKVINTVNGGTDMSFQEIVDTLPTNKEKSNIEKYPTTDGYDVNLKLYDRITDFYDIRYYKDGHYSNVMPGRAKLRVPDCQNMQGSDLLILIIDEKTGEMHLIPPITFDSDSSVMVFDLPCVGPFCVLHKIPIVVRNVDPDLYPNEILAKIIKAMPYNETMECRYFLQKTLQLKSDDKALDKLEVDDGVYIKPDDYTSAIALSDVAVHLGEDEQGMDRFSYDLVTRFKANLFRANDKVNWERMLKYERIKYDKSAIMKDDKELTKIEPFVLEDSFLYHIDAVSREVSIIWEPTICWETYGELTKQKEDKLEQEDIQYFDVDDIDGQEIEDRKLVLDDTDKEELETSSAVDKLIPSVYAADLILDEINEENNQKLEEDDVCLVINGDKYLGMGPFLVFMPKNEHKAGFPWWILAVVAACGGGYAYYRKKKTKRKKQNNVQG